MATALLLTDIVIQFHIRRILSIFRYKDHSLQSAIIIIMYSFHCRKKSRHSGFGFGEESSVIEAPPSKVSEGLINSVFEISTPTNVPADNSGHKVNGAGIEITISFHSVMLFCKWSEMGPFW